MPRRNSEPVLETHLSIGRGANAMVADAMERRSALDRRTMAYLPFAVESERG